MDRKKRVMVIEDDADIRVLVTSLLREKYDVRVTNDGASALKVLAEERFDVIVCDVMMPGENGLEVAMAIRALPTNRSVPIIFLSAKSSVLDVVNGINAGARFYITKPFKTDELRDKVARALNA